MRLIAILLISTWSFTALADVPALEVQQRVAAAYDHGDLRLSAIAKSDLRRDALIRVRELEVIPEIILDYWQAALTDGGPALRVIFIEHQIIDGSGAIEAYLMNGDFLVRGRFDEFTSLTWEFLEVPPTSGGGGHLQEWGAP